MGSSFSSSLRSSGRRNAARISSALLPSIRRAMAREAAQRRGGGGGGAGWGVTQMQQGVGWAGLGWVPSQRHLCLCAHRLRSAGRPASRRRRPGSLTQVYQPTQLQPVGGRGEVAELGGVAPHKALVKHVPLLQARRAGGAPWGERVVDGA